MLEIELVRKVLDGQKDSYGDIVQIYNNKLSRYINRFIATKEDVEDILQNVFIKAYQNLNSFDKDQSFNSWIYRIAHNESVNYLKKHKKIGISFFELDIISPQLFSKEKSDSHTLTQELKKEMELNLDKLGAKYKEILILNYFEDLSYEEISEILKIPISTVGTRIRRAKEKLKEIINKSKK